jgi:hypothetical protein
MRAISRGVLTAWMGAEGAHTAAGQATTPGFSAVEHPASLTRKVALRIGVTSTASKSRT